MGLTVKYKIKTRDHMQNVLDRTFEKGINSQRFFWVVLNCLSIILQQNPAPKAAALCTVGVLLYLTTLTEKKNNID